MLDIRRIVKGTQIIIIVHRWILAGICLKCTLHMYNMEEHFTIYLRILFPNWKCVNKYSVAYFCPQSTFDFVRSVSVYILDPK